MTRALHFTWANGVMTPRHPWIVREQFEEGEHVTLIEHEERSAASHGHAFARLHDIWATLPETTKEQYKLSEHTFRKRLLIGTGHHIESQVDAGSHEIAIRVAAAMASIDEDSVVVVEGPIVVRRVAKSMSRAGMDKHEFQKAKTDILELAESMIADEGQNAG